ILISVDTLRADHLGTYGYAKPTSPNLDAFAREAQVFENALAQGSDTVNSCSSLLTGFFPHETKSTEVHALPLEVETLPEMLASHGYATVAVVSNYVLRSSQGFSQG
ncbi:MAG: sulfatase-like hydrolase/transferase, partial [Acidobacteria bacterium]|nr:sulfatase-like hydrolase/transferase [Acidobacteriota bacterium]NIQ29980.1 sulfatase-like hydrolase/transferase [Acidobacteriota bacterium]NIQ84739.1 sulfatase-like hydrolase/transferase [Acidobacteriota bacterium]